MLLNKISSLLSKNTCYFAASECYILKELCYKCNQTVKITEKAEVKVYVIIS